MHELTPRHLLDSVAAGTTSEHDPDAPVLSVDLVGFTAMAWDLASHGFRGAELLADITDGVFASVVAAIYHHGGYVAEFGGDAVLGIFPVREGRDLAALAAGLEIAEHGSARHVTPFGEYEVLVKVGIARGEMRWDVLSDETGTTATYVHWGTAVVRATELASGGSGESVILDDPVVERLADEVVVVRDAAGRAVLQSLASPPQPLPLPAPEEPHPLAPMFAPTRLLTWDRRGELRPVVTTFLSLGADASIDDVRTLIRHLFRLRAVYGGVVHQVERAEKGWVVLLYGGAPVSFPRDVERSLSLLLDLRDQCPVPFRSGTTVGLAYSGMVGSAVQSGFSCYGSHINLAARIMAGGELGSLRSDASILGRAPGIVDPESLGERTFKGIGRPVEIFELQRPESSAVRRVHPLVGREGETQQIAAVVEEAAVEGAQRRIVLAGEPGVGKTSLLSELRRHDEGVAGSQWLVARAESHSARWMTPVRDLVRRWSDVAPTAAPEAARDSVDRRIAATVELVGPERAAALAGASDVLAALLDVPVPGSSWAATPADERYELLVQAVAAMLDCAAATGPTVLVADDVQWYDEGSLDLLRDALGRLPDRPLVLVATCHDPAQAEGLLGDQVDLSLTLGPLAEPGLVALASGMLGRPAPSWVGPWLARRTEGNPLFAEQLLGLLAGDGLLDSDEPPADVDLPPDLRGTLVSTLDRLSAPGHRAAECAAVLGRRFERTVLARMVTELDGGDPTLDPDLDALAASEAELIASGIWQPERETLAFSHDLLRAAAGDMMLTATTRRLNAAAAVALESEPDAGTGRFTARLADHHRAAGHLARASSYEARASDQALQLGAYRDAARHAEAGLDDLSRADPDPDLQALELTLVLALGSSRMITHGQAAQETMSAYQRAADICEHLPSTRQSFQALFGLRMAAAFRGDLSTAAALGESALAMAEEMRDDDLVLEALLMVGNLDFWRGDLDRALQSLERVRAAQPTASHGEFVQQRRLTALFPTLLSRALIEGDDAVRDDAETGVAEATELGHRFSQAIVLETAAFLAVLGGRPEDARRHGAALVALSEDEGFPTYRSMGAAAVAWADAVLGGGPSSVAGIEAAAYELASFGVRLGTSLMQTFVADAALRTGDVDRALAASETALRHAERTGESVMVPTLQLLRARCLPPRQRAGARSAAVDAAVRSGQTAVLRTIGSDDVDLGASPAGTLDLHTPSVTTTGRTLT
ncbi:MAG: AAA family ATPase [Candidatus Nanopelagicales bacterium]